MVTRVARGVYVPMEQPSTVDKLQALFRVLPPLAAVGFHTAAELYGFGVVPSRQLHVVIPAGTPVPDIKGLAAHEVTLPIGEPVEVAGLPCVSADRCAIDLARFCPRLDSLPVLDAALRSGRCTPESLATEVARHDGLRGVRQARDVVPLADPRAECRQESQLRLIMIDGKLPHPEPQIRVLDEWGVPIFRIDLGYRERQVGSEYDGRSHLDPTVLRHDRERHNWLAAHGWTMRHFTAVDIYRRPGYVVSTMRAALDNPRRSRRC
jgi:very-short-patch-repair endonuclease